MFGEGNVLIVNNSTGTKHDAGQVQVRSTEVTPMLRPLFRLNRLVPSRCSRAATQLTQACVFVHQIDTQVLFDAPGSDQEGVGDCWRPRCDGEPNARAVGGMDDWSMEKGEVRSLEKRVVPVDMVTRWTDRESAFQDTFAEPLNVVHRK